MYLLCEVLDVQLQCVDVLLPRLVDDLPLVLLLLHLTRQSLHLSQTLQC